jgi:hypothetical protein
MNSTQRRALAKTLKLSQKPFKLFTAPRGVKFTSNHWKTLLPEDAGLFLDRRIGLKLQPLVPLNENAVEEPPLKSFEYRRIGDILAALPKILPVAEDEWENYADTDDESPRLEPYISIYRKSLKNLKKPLSWTFIVDLKGTDFGWHIEFKGTRFVEIWAGD